MNPPDQESANFYVGTLGNRAACRTDLQRRKSLAAAPENSPDFSD